MSRFSSLNFSVGAPGAGGRFSFLSQSSRYSTLSSTPSVVSSHSAATGVRATAVSSRATDSANFSTPARLPFAGRFQKIDISKPFVSAADFYNIRLSPERSNFASHSSIVSSSSSMLDFSLPALVPVPVSTSALSNASDVDFSLSIPTAPKPMPLSVTLVPKLDSATVKPPYQCPAWLRQKTGPTVKDMFLAEFPEMATTSDIPAPPPALATAPKPYQCPAWLRGKKGPTFKELFEPVLAEELARFNAKNEANAAAKMRLNREKTRAWRKTTPSPQRPTTLEEYSPRSVSPTPVPFYVALADPFVAESSLFTPRPFRLPAPVEEKPEENAEEEFDVAFLEEDEAAPEPSETILHVVATNDVDILVPGSWPLETNDTPVTSVKSWIPGFVVVGASIALWGLSKLC